MKRKPIIMTEGRLRRIVAEAAMRVIRESGFDSDEDMTMYRDMYAPGTEDTVVDTDNEPYEHRYTDEPGAWGSGPFLDHRTHTFADGYDYCGDDDYNEGAESAGRGGCGKLGAFTAAPGRAREGRAEVIFVFDCAGSSLLRADFL